FWIPPCFRQDVDEDNAAICFVGLRRFQDGEPNSVSACAGLKPLRRLVDQAGLDIREFGFHGQDGVLLDGTVRILRPSPRPCAWRRVSFGSGAPPSSKTTATVSSLRLKICAISASCCTSASAMSF